MRKTKEILRLKFDQRMSNRKIAQSCGTSHSVVADYLCRAKKAGLDWLQIAKMDDAEIEAKLFLHKAKDPKSGRRMPVMENIHFELKKKGVTLQLLWHEYKYDDPEGYQYSQYCELYRRWSQKLDVSLRQQHRAGEKLFIDYAGHTIPIINPITGKSTEAQIFLATFGASCYTFVEASPSQALPFWIKSHIHAFEYFEGVSALLIPDNLKSGVNKACRYEPDLNPTYHELANHYGTTVIPARVRKPKDKSKVENAVKIAENWILAALRNHTFFSLAELNQVISQKLEDFNNRKFQKLDTTRRELFLKTDKPALQPLPRNRYEYADWAKARVNMDYHIEVDRHHYSVPYQLVRELLDVRITDTIVEILNKNQRVASHIRSYEQGGQTTLIVHMPKSHQKYLEWTPSRLLSWAEKNGTNTNRLFNKIMKKKIHTEQAFRSCLGIMRLEKRYTAERLEAACTRAFFIQSFSYKSVESILKNGLDQQPHPFGEVRVKATPVKHPNIRGNQYYK
jgi:transposase